MADRVASGLLLAGHGSRACALRRIAAISFDLLKRLHGRTILPYENELA
jgi:hypothetical protein